MLDFFDLQNTRDYLLFVLASMILTLIALLYSPAPTAGLLIAHFVFQIGFWILFWIYSRLLIQQIKDDDGSL